MAVDKTSSKERPGTFRNILKKYILIMTKIMNLFSKGPLLDLIFEVVHILPCLPLQKVIF